MKKIRPIVKIHGGKYYLCDWILHHFPQQYENMTYLEPFVGGGSIFLNKNKSIKEIINDIDYGIYAIWHVLKNNSLDFILKLKNTNYTKDIFQESQQYTNKDIFNDAVNSFILRRMSRGGLQKAFSWSDRLRGGRPGDENAFYTMVNSLSVIANKLKQVDIYNQNALELIKNNNHSNVLLYLDPPYMHNTRISKTAYNYEMTENDHKELSIILNKFNGKVVLSGYRSPQYDKWYQNWNMVSRQIVNHSSQQKIKQYKTECLWVNYDMDQL